MMLSRVKFFSTKEEVNILESFSFESEHPENIAIVSDIVREFIGGIKAGNPPKPHYHLEKECPGTIRGIPKNFETPKGNVRQSFGRLYTIQVAQDENGVFYLRFFTLAGSYYVAIP